MFSPKVASAVPAERANPEASQALRKSNGAGASLLKARRTKSKPRSIGDGEGGALAIVPPDDRVPKLREQVTHTSAACDHMVLARIVSQASRTPLFFNPAHAGEAALLGRHRRAACVARGRLLCQARGLAWARPRRLSQGGATDTVFNAILSRVSMHSSVFLKCKTGFVTSAS
jgi:hypothetical protein